MLSTCRRNTGLGFLLFCFGALVGLAVLRTFLVGLFGQLVKSGVQSIALGAIDKASHTTIPADDVVATLSRRCMSEKELQALFNLMLLLCEPHQRTSQYAHVNKTLRM